jgi:NAD(P)H-hydrate epimerase
MRFATAARMREMDRITIAGGVPGITLMERAGHGLFVEAMSLLGPRKGRTVVLCGRGNNGGDGFVVARLLHAAGREVYVLSVAPDSEISGDALLALRALREAGCPVRDAAADAVGASLAGARLAVDALLGTGTAGTLRDPFPPLIGHLNAAPCLKLAVDIPSGLSADTGLPVGGGEAVDAHVTATFGLPKPGLLLYPGARYAGRVVVVDIGLDDRAMADADGLVPESRDVAAWLPDRAPDAHKGDAGRVWIVAGSPGLAGAACLAARAACRSGGGLVTVAAPRSVCASIEARTLESMTWALGGPSSDTLSSDGVGGLLDSLTHGHTDAVAVGPGLSRNTGTLEAVRELLTGLRAPIVLDADGLYALPEWDATAREGRPLVLTPHPGEMAAVMGTSVEEVQADRLRWAAECARRFGAAVVLKGARSVVAGPTGRLAINTTGHEGMASGGMGDVLTGVVVALLGQGLGAFEAACAAAYAHGFAAELAGDALGGRIGIVAGDVIEQLPRAFALIRAGRGPACPVATQEKTPYPMAEEESA